MPRRQKKRNLKAPPGIRRKPGRLPEGRPFDQLPPGGEDLPPVDKTGDDILLKIIVADLTSCRDIIRFAGTDTKFRRVVIENLPYLYTKLRQVVPYFPQMEFTDTPENNYQKFVKKCHDFFDRFDFDLAGYDEYGYNREGIYRRPYDPEGYDPDGYDWFGFNREGFNKETGTTSDWRDFDRDGFYGGTPSRFNSRGFDREGFHEETGTKVDSEGYDSIGYDKYGFNRNGLDYSGGTFEDYFDYEVAQMYGGGGWESEEESEEENEEETPDYPVYEY